MITYYLVHEYNMYIKKKHLKLSLSIDILIGNIKRKKI